MSDPEQQSTIPGAPSSAEPLKKLSDMLPLSRDERIRHQLRIMDTLMARATLEKDFAAALKIMESAQRLLARHTPK